MLARGLRAAAAATLRRGLLGVRGLSAASVNPLGVAVPTAPKPPLDDSVRRAVAHYRNLPVSPKKLRVVANLTPKLYWREAMMQLEFCRKNMAVMVKNCIESAVGNAEYQGMAKDRLIVGAYATYLPPGVHPLQIALLVRHSLCIRSPASLRRDHRQ
eukprot:scaffold129604_cov39-Tisochrysis_lutea.AAC.2